MAKNPPLKAVGKLRFALGNYLSLIGAFSFFLDEIWKARFRAQQLLVGGFRGAPVSNIYRMESLQGTGLV
jgi:hypothetical protein